MNIDILSHKRFGLKLRDYFIIYPSGDREVFHTYGLDIEKAIDNWAKANCYSIVRKKRFPNTNYQAANYIVFSLEVEVQNEIHID